MPNPGLHKKILLSTSLVVSLLVSCILLSLNFMIREAMSLKITKDVQEARIVFARYIENRFESLVLNSKIAADSPVLKSVVATAGVDHSTVLSTARDIHKIIASDLFIVADSRGMVLARIELPAQYGEDISKEFFVRDALGGEPQAFFSVREDKLYQVVVLPVILRGVVEGVLVAGFLIDHKITEILKEMTGCEIGFLNERRLFASSGTKDSAEIFHYLSGRLARRTPSGRKQPLFINHGSEKYVTAIIPVSGLSLRGSAGSLDSLRQEQVVFGVITRSLAEAMKFYYQRVQSLLLVIGGAAIGMVILLSWFFAGSISRPILRLSAAAGAIARGDLTQRVKEDSHDELGLLERSFNHMAGALGQREREIKEAQEQLAQWNRLLEKRVEERAVRLKEAQAQLAENAKMASLGQLAGSIAHEINNPLTGVLNNAQLLKGQLDEGRNCGAQELSEVLDMIEESALRCKRIVQSLLDFSRPRHTFYQPVNVNDILEKTFMLAEFDIKINQIDIVKEYGLNLPDVSADTHSLQQVFLNILNNAKWALKDKKDAALRIKTCLYPDDRFVAVEFCDNGCGIQKADLPFLFEPFWTTKKIGEGTGLGLSICYGIIKEHKGIIEVESPGKGRGATFRVSLPVAFKKSPENYPPLAGIVATELKL